METKVSSPKEWLREIEVEIEPDRLRSEVSKMLDSYQERAEIPGFRKGRVPRKVLEKRLGEAAEQSVVQEILEQTAAEVLAKQDFRVAAQPDLADFEVLPDKTIRFRLKVEVYPDFKLGDYKGLVLQRHEPSGFEQEFEKRLAALQDKCARFKTVLRPAGSGDFIVADWHTFDGEREVADPKTGMMLELGDKLNFPEVNEELAGVKAGEERAIEVEFPADHPEKTLAGRKITFRFTVREVKEKTVPEVDEDLALDLGYDDLDALRKDINDRILNDREQLVENDLKNQIFDRLLKQHEFEPPDSWVKANLDRLRREYELPEDAGTTEKLRQVAARRARFDMIAVAIADAEQIRIDADEIQRQVAAFAKQAGKPVDEIAPLIDNPAFRDRMLRDKVMDFILAQAEVRDPTADRLDAGGTETEPGPENTGSK